MKTKFIYFFHFQKCEKNSRLGRWTKIREPCQKNGNFPCFAFGFSPKSIYIKSTCQILVRKVRVSKEICQEPNLLENFPLWGRFTRIVTLTVLDLKQQLGLSCLKKPCCITAKSLAYKAPGPVYTPACHQFNWNHYLIHLEQSVQPFFGNQINLNQYKPVANRDKQFKDIDIKICVDSSSASFVGRGNLG